jgi:hypothetical protein
MLRLHRCLIDRRRVCLSSSLLSSLFVCLTLATVAISAASTPPPSNAHTYAHANHAEHNDELRLDAVTVLLPHPLQSITQTYVVYFPLYAHGRPGSCFVWQSTDPKLVNFTGIPDTRCTAREKRFNSESGEMEEVTVTGFEGVYVFPAVQTEQSLQEAAEAAAAAAAAAAADTSTEGGGAAALPTENRDSNGRITEFLIAREIGVRRSAKCEVFIDAIVRLDFLTSTRQINVGDVNILGVQAYDAYNNVFSSLEGLPFRWENTNGTRLNPISMEEAKLVVSSAVWNLENREHRHTNIQAVRGVQPGRVNVSVQLENQGEVISNVRRGSEADKSVTASGVIATTAEFLVIEPIELRPTSLILCPAAEVPLRLQTTFKARGIIGTSPAENGMETRLISMPHPQYKWVSDRTGVATVDHDMGVVRALDTGTTTVAAYDMNLPTHKAHCKVTVAHPAAIKLNLWISRPGVRASQAPLRKTCPIDISTGVALGAPGSPSSASAVSSGASLAWFIKEGSFYEFVIQLVDAAGSSFAITPNMKFPISQKGSAVAFRHRGAAPVGWELPDASAQILQGVSPGTSSVTVQLYNVTGSTVEYILTSTVDGVTPEPLVSRAVVRVTPGVEIRRASSGTKPNVAANKPLRVPFVGPQARNVIHLRAEGGSEVYKWSTSDTDLLVVGGTSNETSASSVALITQRNKGKVLVHLTDACNQENKANLTVELLAPKSVEFLQPERQEALVPAARVSRAEGAMDYSQIDLYVRVAPEGNMPAYEDCSALYLQASFVSGAGVFKIERGASTTEGAPARPAGVFQCLTSCPVGDPSFNCFHLTLRASSAGFASLRVHLVEGASAHSSPVAGVQPATIALAAFEEMHASPGRDYPLVLAEGSAQTVQLRGGPLAWPDAGISSLPADFSPKSATIENSNPQTSLSAAGSKQSYANNDAVSAALRASSGAEALVSQQEFRALPDISAKGIISVTPAGSAFPGKFVVKCLRAENERIAVHFFVSQSASEESVPAESALLSSPLVATSKITVYCFPRLSLRPEGASLDSAGEAEVSLSVGAKRELLPPPGTHPLQGFLRFGPDGGESAAAGVIAVERTRGVVSGLKLGQARVRAAVDRRAFLISENLALKPLLPRSIPEPENDGLQTRVLISVEFSGFKIRLSTPSISGGGSGGTKSTNAIVRGSSVPALAYVVGANGETPIDEAYDNVQCEWSSSSGEGAHRGIAIAPVLASGFAAARSIVRQQEEGSSYGSSGSTVTASTGEEGVPPHIYGCGVRLSGLRAGTHTLSVQVTVASVHLVTGTAPTSTSKIRTHFDASTTVQVIEPLRLLSAPSLLLPPGSTAQIRTNLFPLLTSASGAQSGGPHVIYSVLSEHCAAQDTQPGSACAPPWVSVDPRGVISVRKPRQGEQDEDASADAVVLVRTVQELLPGDDAIPSAAPKPVSQSLTVHIAVRPVAQLFVTPLLLAGGAGSSGAATSNSVTPASLLCPSLNYSFAVGVADSFGRRFDVLRADVPYLDDLMYNISLASGASIATHAAQQTATQGENRYVPISVQRVVAGAPAARISGATHEQSGTQSGNSESANQILAHFVLSIGEAPAASAAAAAGHPGSAAAEALRRSLLALQDFMLELRLGGASSVKPLYVPFFVSPSAQFCTEPQPVLLSLRLNLPPKSWSEYPAHSVHRDTFVRTLREEVARAVNLSSPAERARVQVYSVDPSTGSVELLLLPKSISSGFHRDQWFLSYYTPIQLVNSAEPGTISSELVPSQESWVSSPFHLAHILQKQATQLSKKPSSAAAAAANLLGAVSGNKITAGVAVGEKIADPAHHLAGGSVTKFVDSASPFVTRELSLSEAERMLRERSAPSSALSASAPSTGSAASASASTAVGSTASIGDNQPTGSYPSSVWVDERDMATYRRALDSARASGAATVAGMLEADPTAVLRAQVRGETAAATGRTGVLTGQATAVPAEKTGERSTTKGGEKAAAVAAAKAESRRAEEEAAHFKELKRRYELERLKEAAASVGYDARRSALDTLGSWFLWSLPLGLCLLFTTKNPAHNDFVMTCFDNESL